MFENPEQAFGGTSRMLALIELIYSAVNDPLLWPVVLDQISETVQGQQTFLFAPIPSPTLPNALSGSSSSETLTRFTSYYATVNVLAEPCDRIFPSGAVRYSHIAVPDAEFEKSEFYNDFFKPLDLHYSFGLKIPLGNLSPAYLSTQRSKSLGAFNGEGIVLETLMPHLRRALELHLKFVHLQSNVCGLETALDSFEHAVFGLNREGSVILSNRTAEAAVQAGDAIFLTNGVLSCVFPEQNRRLQSILSDAVAAGTGMGLSSGDSLLINRRAGENPLRVVVTPFFSPLPGSAVKLAALVFVSDPASRPQPRGAILRALYGLTPAEGRVADLLLQGLDVREISICLKLTLETARFHTKRVLSKTGAKRQSELMRLMLSLPQL